VLDLFCGKTLFRHGSGFPLSGNGVTSPLCSWQGGLWVTVLGNGSAEYLCYPKFGYVTRKDPKTLQIKAGRQENVLPCIPMLPRVFCFASRGSPVRSRSRPPYFRADAPSGIISSKTDERHPSGISCVNHSQIAHEKFFKGSFNSHAPLPAHDPEGHLETICKLRTLLSAFNLASLSNGVTASLG